MSETKETRPPRPGEEIDPAALASYLAENGIGGEVQISQFPAGSSNLTYLIAAGGSEFVLRRPPFGNVVKSAHDMRREFDVLSKLNAVYSKAPRPLLFCDDVSMIGSEFYLMERRSGLIIRGTAPDAMLTNANERDAVCRAFISDLARLHAIDHRAAGLSDLGNPDGYNRRQVEGWAKRYDASATDDLPEMERVADWLARKIGRAHV